MTDTKWCNDCKRYLPVSSFGRNKAKRDGLTTQCLECKRERSRAYAAKNRARERERVAQWRSNNPGGKFIQTVTKWDASLGVPTDTTISILGVAERDMWVCQLCGNKVPTHSIPFTRGMTPSIDHVIPKTHDDYPGTTWDNVQLAHFRCNNAKRDLSMEEWNEYLANQRANGPWFTDM